MSRRLPRTLTSFDRRHLAPGAAAFVVALLVALIGLRAGAEEPVAGGAPPAREGTAQLRLLGVNDFHGHLEPPESGRGGGAWLAAALDGAELPGRTIRVHAGDMVGASPLVSAYFHDEPSIEVANDMGFDVGTVGNHEFDEGGDELLRLLAGGRRSGPEALKPGPGGQPVNTSSPGFAGAAFPYLAANTIDRDGRPLLPPYRVVERDGVRVGFIGVTTPSTPRFLLPRFSRRFRFLDISDTVDRYAAELTRQGVRTIVVLAHEGAPSQGEDEPADAEGPIVTEAREMTDEVDVIVAGHSHSTLDLRLPNRSGPGDKLVVEASSYGVAYGVVDLTVDRSTGEVVAKRAETRPVRHDDDAGDEEVRRRVAAYAERLAPVGDRVVRPSGPALTRGGGELLAVAADAQRALAGADFALVNAGSLRGDLPAGRVTYADLARVQAYDFRLIRMEMRGRAIAALARGGSLAVAGDATGIDPAATYSVVANELIATGGMFTVLRDEGRDRQAVGTEIQALDEYLSGSS